MCEASLCSLHESPGIAFKVRALKRRNSANNDWELLLNGRISDVHLNLSDEESKNESSFETESERYLEMDSETSTTDSDDSETDYGSDSEYSQEYSSSFTLE